MRGFFGIALYQPKNTNNYGTLLRSANILGASFISIIGKRFQHQCSDTLKTYRHVPVFEYKTFEEFKNSIPFGAKLIGVELEENAELVENFKHPQQAVYLFGSEDNGIPKNILTQCQNVIKLRGDRSLNLSVAGSIVLYERGRNK